MKTLCDVIDNCTECPRYGDDCDGSAERLYTHEEAWGMCDLISRADAIYEVLVNDGINNIVDRINKLPSAEADGEDLIIKGAKGIKDGLYNIKDGKLFEYKAKGGTVRTYPIVPSADAVSREECIDAITKCRERKNKEIEDLREEYHELLRTKISFANATIPTSAEAEPTVIRSITRMPTKNFMEWAKRIRETNPNAVIIPCDAEVVSVETEWIPCSERLPSDGDTVIVSVVDDNGDMPWKYTTVAWLCNGVWISDNDILCGTAVAWMPLPKPYREDGEA